MILHVCEITIHTNINQLQESAGITYTIYIRERDTYQNLEPSTTTAPTSLRRAPFRARAPPAPRPAPPDSPCASGTHAVPGQSLASRRPQGRTWPPRSTAQGMLAAPPAVDALAAPAVGEAEVTRRRRRRVDRMLDERVGEQQRFKIRSL
jgi:hypothetical protein